MEIDIAKLQIIEGNLASQKHRVALMELINVYLNDAMGEGRAQSAELGTQLISGLRGHPGALLFFAEYAGKLIGLATCFIGFSTFEARKLMNIHDLIVLPEYRRQGVAEKILLFVEEEAKLMDCCKLTLEVRTDNAKAMLFYRKLGFNSGKAPMFFWTKPL